MSRLKTLGVFALASIVQFALISRIEVFGVSPNIFIPTIILITLGFGQFKGSYLGLFFGLVEDLLFSSVLGIRALIYFVLAYILGFNSHMFNIKDLKTGLLLTIILTILVNLAYLGLAYFTGTKLDGLMFLKIILIEGFLNALCYYVLLKTFRKVFIFPDIIFYR